MSLPSTAEISETKTEAASLVRELGTIDAAMIVVGSMIGSGIFITSAESARYVGAPGWLLLAWGLAGLMTITGSLCAAEIAAMMPKAGGQYVFLREAYSPMFGFLFGWAMFLVVQTGTIAAVAVAFAKFLGVFFPGIAADHYAIEPIHFGGYAVSLSSQQLVALALIAFLTLVNTRGLKLGKWIQNTFTFTKTAALIGLIVVGLLLGSNFESAAWTSCVVGFDRQRLGPSWAGAGSSAGRTDRAVALARSGDDRATFFPVGLEQRHIHRRRSPRPGPHAASRLDTRRVERRHSLLARQCRLYRHAQSHRDPACAPGPRRDSRDGGDPGTPWRQDHGGRRS